MENNLSFEEIFKLRNPQYEFLLSRMRCAMDVKEVKFTDINSVNLRKFRDYMEGEVANNSLRTYMAVIKAVINSCIDDGLIENARCIKELRVKSTPSQHCCLTEEELIKFDEYKPRTQTEKDVKILFMRGAFSGARSCDCAVMNMENTCDGHLTYVSKKTKVGVTQPIHARLPKYLEMKPLKEHHRMVVNRIIQEICKRLGFTEPVTLNRNGKMVTKPKYQWITMHCSRRTYVTSLANRGVPITIISKLAGHCSTNMTDRYVCGNTLTLNDDAMAFFNDESLK